MLTLASCPWGHVRFFVCHTSTVLLLPLCFPDRDISVPEILCDDVLVDKVSASWEALLCFYYWWPNIHFSRHRTESTHLLQSHDIPLTPTGLYVIQRKAPVWCRCTFLPLLPLIGTDEKRIHIFMNVTCKVHTSNYLHFFLFHYKQLDYKKKYEAAKAHWHWIADRPDFVQAAKSSLQQSDVRKSEQTEYSLPSHLSCSELKKKT